MRSRAPIIILTALAPFSVSATSVTIDFEELPDQSGELCSPGCTEVPASWTTKGYLIEGVQADNDPLFPGAVIDDFTLNNSGLGMFFCGSPCGEMDFYLSQSNGGVFSLFSLDYVYTGIGGGPPPTFTIKANLSGGGSVITTLDLGAAFDDWATVSFGSEWGALDSLVISSSNANGALDAIGFDNLVVTAAVPVPAAFWLFGSALAGLGWLRRSRSS